MIACAQATVSWFHNNSELRQSVKYMKRYGGDDYSFVINRVKTEDRGEYIIRAENHWGVREEFVFLDVKRMYSTLFNTIYLDDCRMQIYFFVLNMRKKQIGVKMTIYQGECIC